MNRSVSFCSNKTMEYVGFQLRRFCSEQNIHYRSNLSAQELDRVVQDGVIAVGRSYGRRTMHGLLASKGVLFLAEVHP